jgi:ribosomal protein S18 acetylase RimI-like enzyme
MVDLASRSDDLVARSFTRRFRDGDVVVRDTPERRDYWFGHGYELSSAPDHDSLARRVVDGRARFASIPGTQRFVILDEYPHGLRSPLSSLPETITVQRDAVLVYGEPACAPRPDDPATHAIAPDDDDAWRAIAAATIAEYGVDDELRAFHTWMTARLRADARAGRLDLVGVTVDGALAAFAGMYGDPILGIARFTTPITAPSYRRRGLFGACARRLIASTLARGVGTIVICAEPESPQERLYRSLGFRRVADRDAYLVELHPTRGARRAP